MKFKIWFLFLAVLIIFSCTQKNNPVGYVPVNQPRYIELKNNVFDNIFSYEDTVRYYQNSTVLSLGKKGDYYSNILIRFLTLPDSVAEIENDVINMKLCVNKQLNSFSNPIEIRKINQYWNQNYVTYKAASDTIDWESPYFYPPAEETAEFEIEDDDFYLEHSAGDTINISMPLELFYEYDDISGLYFADSLAVNYGIIMMLQQLPDDDQVIEFYSNEASDDFQPELSFNYKVDSTDLEFTQWTNATAYDAIVYNSIYDNDLETLTVYQDSLIFRNITPSKLSLGFNELEIKNSLIADDSTGLNNYQDVNRMTVNKANLVLTAKSDKYLSSNQLYILTYLLTDTTYTDIPVYNEHYQYVSGSSATQDSLSNNQIKIDITDIFQAYLAEGDDISGYGLVIVSSRENRDFSYVSFYNNEFEDKKPYIELFYTPPLLP